MPECYRNWISVNCKECGIVFRDSNGNVCHRTTIKQGYEDAKAKGWTVKGGLLYCPDHGKQHG
jgi:hypothetical protein